MMRIRTHLCSIHRPPRSASFKPVMPPSPNIDSPSAHHFDPNEFTRLPSNAPLQLQIKAFKMYNRCKLSSQHPVTRLAIARQMRILDLPPHQSLWQSITPHDERKLYRWIEEAFGQLMYQKGLWTPYDFWFESNSPEECERRLQHLSLLRQGYDDQLIKPLKAQYGPHAVSSALSELDRPDFIEPPIIWESDSPESASTVLEWMSERTADVVWPGLVSCEPNPSVARRYWESEARRFARQVGGRARGMGPDGSMMDIEPEIGEPVDVAMANDDGGDEVDEARKIAEALLVKEFIAESEKGIKTKKPSK